jgi:hypothetical protein
VPVQIIYNYTTPGSGFFPLSEQEGPAEAYILPPASRNTLVASARGAVDAIIQKALRGPTPPTRFIISMVTMAGAGVQQQAFWTNEMGGTYRVILRADKIMDINQHLKNSIPERESKRGWSKEGKIDRYAKAVVTHELGHMLHAFSDPNKFLTAVDTIATLPLPPEPPTTDPLRPQKEKIARINTNVILALNMQPYKDKWGYARNGMKGNPSEVVAEVFTALMHGRNVPKGLAAVYVAYGGIRSATIDAALKKSFGGEIPTINQPEDAIPIINQP